MILGLDINTVIVGWCLLKDDGNFHNIGFVDLKDYADLYDKADKLFDFVENELSQLKNLKIFIEAPLSRSNNQNVVNLLQRWNGMCCELLYGRLSVKPALIEHRTARKALSVSPPRDIKGPQVKQFLFNKIKELGNIPERNWYYKKTGLPKEFCYDQVDAYITAKAGFLLNISHEFSQ